MKAVLWLLNGTSLPGLWKLILAQEPYAAKGQEITAIPTCSTAWS